ncbi:MAG: hypothetical protein LBT04_08470 [Prevotellaceae bacterium]|nr:hypothetical protein [Prevotellaceae bacterium]
MTEDWEHIHRFALVQREFVSKNKTHKTDSFPDFDTLSPNPHIQTV